MAKKTTQPVKAGPKLLTIDIETRPNIAHVWGLWDQNISLNQLQESVGILSFAAKWRGDKKVEFRSVFHDGHDKMIKRAHALLDEADACIHFNGTDFDIPHLNREFLLSGMSPPSPFAQIDLLQTVRGRFKFASNKLDHVSQKLGIGSKLKHEGHDLWVKCMAGDAKAWSRMRRYNIKDVELTEKVYDKLLPWIKNHPHPGMFNDNVGACPKCGKCDWEKRGFYKTLTAVFRRVQCRGCGAWSRAAVKEQNHIGTLFKAVT